MNFALVGDDASVLPLLSAVAVSREHTLCCAAGADALAPALLPLFPGLRILGHPEELLIQTDVDAVIVASSLSDLLHVSRRMAEAGCAQLVFPRAAQGGEFVYGLSLIRDDTHVTLYPAFELPAQPLARELRRRILRGDLGRIRHLQFEREQPGDAVGDTMSLSRLDEILLQDLALLRAVGGNYKQVTALRTGQTAAGVALATVALAGDELAEATWSLKAVSGGHRTRISVVGDAASLNLQLAGPEPRLTMTVEGQPEQVLVADDAADAGAWKLAEFVQSAQGQASLGDWPECLRVFDTLDATHRSVARRRTIEMHFESTSERSIFKTQMTAIGCGLLSLTLLGLLALLVVGAMLERRSPEQVRAENADFFIETSEFSAGTAEFTAAGLSHLERIAGQADQHNVPVLIGRSRPDELQPLDEQRRLQVAQMLSELGVRGAESRTQIAPADSPKVHWLMRVLRIAWLVPLLVFLALQALVFLARPSARE